MDLQIVKSTLSRLEILGAALILLGMFGVLSLLLPREILIVFFAVTAMATLYYTASILLAAGNDRLPSWVQSVPIWLTFLLPFTITFVLILHYWAAISPLMFVLVIALLAIFFYYWFVVPLALFQQIAEQSSENIVEEWPTLSVLVPAYNETGYVGPCIEALLSADYPHDKLDVIVIDDGSTDETYTEAHQHANDIVSVYRKGNGGKHSALNYGLKRAVGDPIVTIDADSFVHEDALKELVRTFKRNPDAGAVAGNVKVMNRGSLITDLQALEYIIGINTFRRAFDLLGVVTVVPGCLGGFRREVLDVVGGYDSDTLTEDFDATVKILKRGESIHHSNAIVYTEAPDTWRDLYRQRLRWFRGNLQTVIKHRRVIFDGDFGLLHRVAFPYVLFSMSILPFLGVVILGVILLSLLQGAYGDVIGMFGFFATLQVLLSVLAIEIDQDNRWLSRYAPLTVVGYKQFLDGVLIKSFIDVIKPTELSWTSATRARQRLDFNDRTLYSSDDQEFMEDTSND